MNRCVSSRKSSSAEVAADGAEVAADGAADVVGDAAHTANAPPDSRTIATIEIGSQDGERIRRIAEQ